MPSLLLTKSQSLRRESILLKGRIYQHLADELRREFGEGGDPGRIADTTSLVRHLQESGVSLRVIAQFLALYGFRRSHMWFYRRFPSGTSSGGPTGLRSPNLGVDQLGTHDD